MDLQALDLPGKDREAMTSEALPESITPESLTLALRRSGILGEGRVSAVEAENARSTILSRIVRVRLAYEGEAAGAPPSIIFKTGLPERLKGGWNAGRQEVEFYAKVAAATPPGILPRCFEAEWDPKTNDWRLLLEDLGDSHKIVTTWPLPPTFSECEIILRARAWFHAHWWDDSRLGKSIGSWGDAKAVDQFLQRLGGKVAEFEERLGDRLPPARKELYKLLLDRAPRLVKRTDSRRGVTIVHGDAHVWNCFLPRDGGSDVRLFDWDSWRLGVATEDLAYMMAVHWYPDRRRLMEGRLLDFYHDELQSHGISNYDRRALTDDYRLSALWAIVTPVFQAGANIPPLIWWNNFERIHLAVDDLGCRELLE
jgi:Ecdysteroid kinase-like family